jgi:hypothetical protein
MTALAAFLRQRLEDSPFVAVDGAMDQLLGGLFGEGAQLLPTPYKIFFADESEPPLEGFPVSESIALRELDTRLDRWIDDEIAWLLKRSDGIRATTQSLAAYAQQAVKLAENALLSSLLADYHAIFWLAHSADAARQFSSIPRRVGIVDAQTARVQGDELKYRIFSRWTAEMRRQIEALAERVSAALGGEEERRIRFFRLMTDNVLIFTDEFIGPDLRELRSFATGYLQVDFNHAIDDLGRLERAARETAARDPFLAAALRLLRGSATPLRRAMLFEPETRRLLTEHPEIGRTIPSERRQTIDTLTRHVAGFAVLHQLRRAIQWTTMNAAGEVVPLDRRRDVVYSRTTRAVDFGRPGVVDPMVYRFGLMYDITAFSETLGEIARSGRRGEVTSYRQMLHFQRSVLAITERHRLQFEKFLGDGAFYTSRRALRMIYAAADIQRFYSAMRRRGFAFDRGIRIALNYGYYRLLPMKASHDPSDQGVEFYGPGIVELSRLTTGKATKEIEEFQEFLVASGFDLHEVQSFFSPLARPGRPVAPAALQREFYAHLDTSGHLVNEGIVASRELVEQLASELAEARVQLHSATAPWARYIVFESPLEDAGFIGLRLIGRVALKGLGRLEIFEIVPFEPAEVPRAPLAGEPGDLLTLLRQQFHESQGAGDVDGEDDQADVFT